MATLLDAASLEAADALEAASSMPEAKAPRLAPAEACELCNAKPEEIREGANFGVAVLVVEVHKVPHHYLSKVEQSRV